MSRMEKGSKGKGEGILMTDYFRSSLGTQKDTSNTESTGRDLDF